MAEGSETRRPPQNDPDTRFGNGGWRSEGTTEVDPRKGR
jgi:hypothetical protein